MCDCRFKKMKKVNLLLVEIWWLFYGRQSYKMQISSKKVTYKLIWKMIHCYKHWAKTCYIIPTILVTLLFLEKKKKGNISKLSFLLKCATHLSPGHIRTGTTNELSGIIVIPLSSLSIAPSFATKICLCGEQQQKFCHGRYRMRLVKIKSSGLRKYYYLLDSSLQCLLGAHYG